MQMPAHESAEDVQSERTTAPSAPATTSRSACAACSSGRTDAIGTLRVPRSSSSARSDSCRPSGRTYTSDTATPRSSGGGSPVIVARRPPSATAFNVVAACPGAALTALGAPPSVISRTSAGRVAVVVEYLRGAVVADALGLLRARGRDHAGAASRGELDEQATRDSAGSVDDDPAAALDPESLVECLSRGERRTGNRSTSFPGRRRRPGRDGRRRRQHLARPRSVTPERQRVCHHFVAFAHFGHTGAGGYDRPGRL